MKTIIKAMARAMFVSAWTNREEELGRSHGGEELMDVAPRAPKRALYEAYRLAGRFEAMNNLCIPALFVKAMIADGIMSKDWNSADMECAEEKYAREFGHYLAMRALGEGVAWEDDHAKCGIIYPHFDCDFPLSELDRV